MVKKIFISALCGMIIANGLCAAARKRLADVTDITQLRAAIAAAKPGDIIVMADGTWTNAEIDFNSAATEQAPVTLKAKNPGKVILTGSSKLVFSKPYLIASGLLFTGGAIKGNSVIEFRSDYCRLTSTAIVNYNPAEYKNGYYWLYFKGNYNTADHCFFKGKNNMQPLVGNDQDNSRHNAVTFCHFKDIPYTPDNGREIFRIWGYGRSEETGDDGAYFTIEHNFFERAHGEGTEIISLKSNRNRVRFNTIFSTKGGIVGRSGNFNTIEGNFILGNNEKGSTGIRVAGQGHRVVNNYVSNVSGDGLILITGEYIDTALTAAYQPILRAGTPLGRVPRYGHVKNGLFAHNTFINIGGTGINIGASYNANPGADQRVLIPESNRIVNNLVFKAAEGGIVTTLPSKKTPLDRFTFKPNLLESNISFGTPTNDKSSGIRITDPQLSLQNGIYRPSAASPLINKGAGTDITDDMDGQARHDAADIGADEVSKAPVKRKPLTADETGPQWIVQQRKSGNTQY